MGITIDFIYSEDIFICDHHVIVFNMSFNEFLSPVQRILSSRILDSSTPEKFADAFNLLSPHNDVDYSTNLLNNYCLSILDKICPVKTRVSACKPPPWLNDSICGLKRDCRKASAGGGNPI